MCLIILETVGGYDPLGPLKLTVELYQMFRGQLTAVRKCEWLPGIPPPPLLLPLSPFFEDNIPAAFGGQSEIAVLPELLDRCWKVTQRAWITTLREERKKIEQNGLL